MVGKKAQIFALEGLAAVVLMALALVLVSKIYSVDKTNWQRYQALMYDAQQGAVHRMYDANFSDKFFEHQEQMYCSRFYGGGTRSVGGDPLKYRVIPGERRFCEFFE